MLKCMICTSSRQHGDLAFRFRLSITIKLNNTQYKIHRRVNDGVNKAERVLGSVWWFGLCACWRFYVCLHYPRARYLRESNTKYTHSTSDVEDGVAREKPSRPAEWCDFCDSVKRLFLLKEKMEVLERKKIRDDIVSDLTEQLRGVMNGATTNACAKVIQACTAMEVASTFEYVSSCISKIVWKMSQTCHASDPPKWTSLRVQSIGHNSGIWHSNTTSNRARHESSRQPTKTNEEATTSKQINAARLTRVKTGCIYL